MDTSIGTPFTFPNNKDKLRMSQADVMRCISEGHIISALGRREVRALETKNRIHLI